MQYKTKKNWKFMSGVVLRKLRYIHLTCKLANKCWKCGIGIVLVPELLATDNGLSSFNCSCYCCIVVVCYACIQNSIILFSFLWFDFWIKYYFEKCVQFIYANKTVRSKFKWAINTEPKEKWKIAYAIEILENNLK